MGAVLDRRRWRCAVFQLHGVAESGRGGATRGVLVVARDVSVRRAMEAQLHMAASVFQAAHEGMFITDPSGRILDVNPAFTQISGYGRDEAMGALPNIIASRRRDRAFCADMWAHVGACGAFTGKIVTRARPASSTRPI